MLQEGPKEVLSELFREEVPIVETKLELEVPEEVERLEGVAKELHTIQPVKSNLGKIIVQPVNKKQVKITVPLTKNQYLANLRQPTENSIRWLAAWIGRLVKMFPGKIGFR